MAIAREGEKSREVVVVGWWIIMLPQTPLHWLSSAEVGVKFGAEQYLWFWMRFLSEIFWIHLWDGCTLVSNNFKFLVCLSVCSLPHFFTKIRLMLDISSSG